MKPLSSCIAVVTGASSGIGKAIAIELASHGTTLCLLGRNRNGLQGTAEGAGRYHAKAFTYELDITDDPGVANFAQYAENALGGVDILVHCAGAYGQGELANTPIEDLDALYKANVRGPYRLTQALLEMLKKGSGRVVFINSTLGLQTRRGVGQFASTQHAMKAITETLRDEINPLGIRVVSIYAGRTATPRMAAIFQMEGKAYRPELLLQPEDIATVVAQTLQLPDTAEVTDIHIRPFLKSY